MLRRIVPDFNLLDESEVVFACNCSVERVERTLISLGYDELTEMLQEDKEIEVVCDFCNEPYKFSPERIAELQQLTKS
ncbi:33 kDa chaperonin [compost metagenome]